MGPIRVSPGHSPNAGSSFFEGDFNFINPECGQLSLSPDSTIMTITKHSSPVQKRKHSEKRREGWRIAVRKRRSAQSDAFQDLKEALALPESDSFPGGLKGLNQVDVLRLAVSFVKLRSALGFMRASACKEEESTTPNFLGGSFEALLPEGGFVIIMSTTGEIMYVSGNVVKNFGCDKASIIGSNLHDYIEKSDASELNKLLSVREMQEIVPAGVDAFKAPTNTAQLHLRSGHCFQVTGKVFLKTGLGSLSPNSTANRRSGSSGRGSFFVGVAEHVGLPSPYDSKALLPQITVLGSIDWMCSADMKTMIHCEPEYFLGYTPDDMFACNTKGTPFDMYFPEDLCGLRDDFQKLFTTGQHEFGPVRILAKHGGWAWFISHASTVVVKTQNADGSIQTVTHLAGRDFMISEVLEPEKVVAAIQLGYNTEPEELQPEATSSFVEVEQESDLSALTGMSWDNLALGLDMNPDELLELIGELEYVCEHEDSDSNSNTTSSIDELCSSLGPELTSFKNQLPMSIPMPPLSNEGLRVNFQNFCIP